jgi:hypothetical protein
MSCLLCRDFKTRPPEGEGKTIICSCSQKWRCGYDGTWEKIDVHYWHNALAKSFQSIILSKKG